MIRTYAWLLLMGALCATGCSPSQESTEMDSLPDAAEGASVPFLWPTFDEAVEAATTSGKPILIDIYAPWCGWCRKMQHEVYGNTTLAAYVRENFEYGRLNIDDSETRHLFKEYDLTSEELSYALGAQGTPTTVFLEQNGDYIQHFNGYQDLQTFGNILQYVGSRAYRTQAYRE